MSSAKFQKPVFQLHAITFQDRDLKNGTVKATKHATGTNMKMRLHTTISYAR